MNIECQVFSSTSITLSLIILNFSLLQFKKLIILNFVENDKKMDKNQLQQNYQQAALF